MTRLTISLATMLWGVLALSRPAHADDPPCTVEAAVVQAMKQRDPSLAEPTNREAKDLKAAGKLAFGVQDFAAAIKDYADAGKLDPAPVLLFDLAQTYRGNQEYERAIRQYDTFLQRGKPGPEVKALVVCWISSMKSELQHAASTAPPTGPADGNEGPPTTTTPTITGPTATAPTTTTPAAPPIGNARIGTRVTPRPSSWTTGRKVAAGIALVGAGALVAGAVFEIQTADLRNQADGLCPTSPCSKADQANALIDRANSRSTLGGASLGVGGALAVGAAVLWFIGGPSSPSTSGDAALVPQIGPSFAGVAYTGSF